MTFGGVPPEELTGKGAEFVKKYRDKYKAEPQAYAVYGYVAAKVALDAISKVASRDRAAVRDAIQATAQVDGALGTWKFDKNGDTTMTVMSGNVVENGKFKFATLLGTGAGAAPAAAKP